jgi:hypothetical protein
MDVTLTYYDRLLVAIAASLVAGGLVGVASAVRPHEGLLAGAVLATGFVYLGLFRNPPLPETSTRVKAAAIVWHGLVVGLLLVALL